MAMDKAEAERMEVLNVFSCELEDWFHILDSDRVPPLEAWDTLPLRVEQNTERLLELLDEYGIRATFFCLGWIAEMVPQLVRRCRDAGHEIGSHGYGHVLAYRVGQEAFRQDIARSKGILEDLLGEEVRGFRSPGFCVRRDSRWVFDVVVETGFTYDASVFPTHHGHGGWLGGPPVPHLVRTRHGPLAEIPVSTVSVRGRRLCLFGGGYLRISPLPVIRWGIRRLHAMGQPLIVYIHPRELDPDQPRLPLAPLRRFKCYTGLRSTLPKLRWLFEHYRFTTMSALATSVFEQTAVLPQGVPVRYRSQRQILPAVRMGPQVPVPVEQRLTY